MKKLMTIAFLSIVLQGCATRIVTPEQKIEAKAILPKIENNKAQVCFIRNGGQAPMWKPDVYENGNKIGELSYNSYFCQNTTGGDHKYIVTTRLDYDREVDVKLSKNIRNYINYTVKMGALSGNGELTEINEDEALSKIYEIDN